MKPGLRVVRRPCPISERRSTRNRTGSLRDSPSPALGSWSSCSSVATTGARAPRAYVSMISDPSVSRSCLVSQVTRALAPRSRGAPNTALVVTRRARKSHGAPVGRVVGDLGEGLDRRPGVAGCPQRREQRLRERPHDRQHRKQRRRGASLSLLVAGDPSYGDQSCRLRLDFHSLSRCSPKCPSHGSEPTLTLTRSTQRPASSATRRSSTEPAAIRTISMSPSATAAHRTLPAASPAPAVRRGTTMAGVPERIQAAAMWKTRQARPTALVLSRAAERLEARENRQ